MLIIAQSNAASFRTAIVVEWSMLTEKECKVSFKGWHLDAEQKHDFLHIALQKSMCSTPMTLKYNIFVMGETFRWHKLFSFVWKSEYRLHGSWYSGWRATQRRIVIMHLFNLLHVYSHCLDDKAPKDNKSLIITCFYYGTARYLQRELNLSV